VTWLGVAGMLAATGVAFAAVRLAPAEAAPIGVAGGRAPNVLILLLDTVRAASMSVYGYERPTTPRIHQLADGGVTFDQAVSPSSWTLPSHASLFTGVAPHALQADWRTPLGRRHETLAERFRAQGYRTGGFVANNWYTAAESGLDRGFNRWLDFELTLRQWRSTSLLMRLPLTDQLVSARSWREVVRALTRPALLRLDPVPPYPRKRADRVSREFLDWQSERPSAPFFAFLNYYDAHDPYRPPPPYDTRFAAQPTAQDQYDGAIAYLDAHLGALLDSLQARGLMENTIVGWTADHGELFGENGKEGHGNGVFWRTVHVPLIVVAPGRVPAGMRIPQPVSQLDLARLLLDLAGIEAGRVGGASLAGFWKPNAAPPSLAVLAEFWPSRAADSTGLPLQLEMAVFSDSLQLIRFGDGREGLYNLHQDPSGSTEAVRVAASHPEVGRLRALMETALEARAPRTPPSVATVAPRL